MKFLGLLFLFSFSSSFGQVWQLERGKGTYEVKHLVKRVQGESQAIKGKMECGETECEFLVAVPVNSFTSSDSNRDLNMQMAVESSKYPLASAKGKFTKADLAKGSWKMPADVEFHGIKKQYQIQMHKKGEAEFMTDFTLMLVEHSVKRPSLFGIELDNEVPMHFEMQWKSVN